MSLDSTFIFFKFQNQIHYNQLFQSDYNYDNYDYYGDNYDSFIHDNYMRESHLIKPQHRKSFFGRVLSKFQYFSRPILSERQAIAPLLGPIFAGILSLVAFAGKFFFWDCAPTAQNSPELKIYMPFRISISWMRMYVPNVQLTLASYWKWVRTNASA